MNRPTPDEHVLRDLLAALPHIVLLIDGDRRIRYLNRAEVGYRIEDAIGADAAAFIQPEGRDEWVRIFERALSTRQAESSTTEVVTADGGTAWYESTFLALGGEDRRTYVAVISKNVTERVSAERDLAMLETVLPRCERCHRVRTGDGRWRTVGAFVAETSGARISHGMCPRCEARETVEDPVGRGG